MIVVSGGSRGIGRAICLQLLAEGKDVLAIARGEEGLHALKNNISTTKGKLLTYSADLSKTSDCAKLCSWVAGQPFVVKAVINNAGQYDTASLLSGATDQLESLLQLNLLAAHRLTRGLLNEQMTHLITIGSVAALDLPERMAAYTVSKYALHGWHHMMAKELESRGVHCSLIVPGATLTSAWDGESNLPDGILQPSEIADAVSTQLAAKKGNTIIIRPST